MQSGQDIGENLQITEREARKQSREISAVAEELRKESAYLSQPVIEDQERENAMAEVK